MSLEIIRKKHLVLKENIYIVPNDVFFDLSRAIIPISDFFQKCPRLDLYTGMENIPFVDRDPEYKNILLSEFL
ncbi:unnamed protein product [marine sediment metagenome]|uniref:Uncharacterized protein n=1 Tax=marine sediment metagenome TaxID=412755 RepID=X1IA87_9ZZZZ